MRDMFTFENQLSIMQTKYEILISRKQILLQQILYINEFIHSFSVQNKYFCMEIFLEVYCLQQNILNWQKSQYRYKTRQSFAFTYTLCKKAYGNCHSLHQLWHSFHLLRIFLHHSIL